MNDIDKLATATKNSFDKVDKRFDKVESSMTAMESRLNKKIEGINKKIDQSQKEVIHEFKALAENIHQDVAEVNHNKISLIEQKQLILGKRVAKIEHKVGI